jgi:surfeit locus 1 family protein
LKRIVIPLIFGLAGAAVLVALGVWQMQRLAWKEGVLAEIDARIAAPPKALPATPEMDRDRYRPVRVRGELKGDPLRVLVSRKQIGAGYRIIAPLVTGGGRRIMVDLGFIPTDAEPAEIDGRRVDITGNLHWPDEVDDFTPAPDMDAGIWFARDVPAMAARLDTEPVLVIARTVSPPVSRVEPLPVDTSAIPNDHLGYAVTWFLLAVVWLAMTWALIRRGRQGMKGRTT